jgi:hypothetical protein
MTNEEKLKQMKEEASKNQDAIVFNAINAYERSGNDVTVLVKMIKSMYDASLKNQ